MMYAHIIIGGGCAGLQLLRALLQNPATAQQSVLILDVTATVPAKSWCFWLEKEHPYTALVEKSWAKINVTAYKDKMVEEILPLHYQYISSVRFYAYHHALIAANTHVHHKIAEVHAVAIEKSHLAVSTAAGVYYGQHVYDSRLPPTALPEDTLQQHFLGWFVTASAPCFEPDAATLMDFDIADETDTGFCYMLPFDVQRALVEMTFFTREVFQPAQYTVLLEAYLANAYPGIGFVVTRQEVGQIPMTAHRFAGQEGQRFFRIGASAGMTKPSTGFTFTRILRDSEALVRHVASGNRAVKKYRGSQGRFLFYDTLLLGILRREPQSLKRLMYRLFSTQSFKKVLLFLDERTHLGQEASIFMRLPIRLFLYQVWLTYIKNKR